MELASAAAVAFAAFAACSCSSPVRTPVVQIPKPKPFTRTATRNKDTATRAAPASAVEQFDAALKQAKKRCAYVVSAGAKEFEASNNVRYCFDQKLHLGLVESAWSSEGLSGDAAYIFENDALTCMRQSDRSQGATAPATVYCVGTGGAALDENDPDESIRRITPEEYASLVSGARTATSEFSLPGPADAGGCSSFVEYEPQPIGEDTTYTPTSGIEVPSALCDKTDELSASVGNVRFPP